MSKEQIETAAAGRAGAGVRILADYHGVVFDLDGVLTDTAALHFQAWAELVQLVQPSAGLTQAEYRQRVDGRPRVAALAELLKVRGIDLPLGSALQEPGCGTVHGLAAHKQARYLELLAERGANVFADAEALARRLHPGVPLAIVTASRNLSAVLAGTGLAELFAVTVDGKDILELGLAGKPAPDPYLEAARRLRLAPTTLAMVEDAVAGVASGRAAGYGLVVGLDRSGRETGALRAAGADVVVTDLRSL